METQTLNFRSPTQHVAAERDDATESVTSYAEGTEALQFTLSGWKARGLDKTCWDGSDTCGMDSDIKNWTGSSFVRPRVTGDSILEYEVPPTIEFVVVMGFPNLYCDGDSSEFDTFVYTLLPVVEILAYDGCEVTVRTESGYVFPGVRVVGRSRMEGLLAGSSNRLRR